METEEEKKEKKCKTGVKKRKIGKRNFNERIMEELTTLIQKEEKQMDDRNVEGGIGIKCKGGAIGKDWKQEIFQIELWKEQKQQ